MKISQAAQVLNCTSSNIWRLIKAGKLPIIEAPGITQVSDEAVAAYKAGQHKQPQVACVFCGITVTTERKTRRYCGAQCRYAAAQHGSLPAGFARIPDHPAGRMFRGTCQCCGLPYETPRLNRRYCSPSCAGRAKQRRQWNIPESRWKGEQKDTRRNLRRQRSEVRRRLYQEREDALQARLAARQVRPVAD